MPGNCVGNTQTIECLETIRSNANGGMIGDYSFVDAINASQRVPEIGVGSGKGGKAANSFLIYGDGIIKPALLGENDTEIVQAFRVVAVQAKRFSIFSDCGFGIPIILECIAEIKMCSCQLRTQAKRMMEGGNGRL